MLLQFSGQTTTHFFIFFPSIFSQKWNFKKFSISQKGGVFPHERTHTVENPRSHQMTLDYFYGQSGELFSYFRIPKALFQDSRFRQLSTDARTLYGILLDRIIVPHFRKCNIKLVDLKATDLQNFYNKQLE